jgi:2-iminobutanoate/2-iminopropanoate deaminase
MKFFRFCMLLGVTAYAASALGQTGADSKPLVQFSNPPELGTPNGYSYVAVVTGGKIVFISGQVGLNKQGEMAGKNDFRAQAMQAFSNLKAALVASGAGFENVVKLNYYVVGVNHDKLLALREVRDQFINKAHPPTSTLAGVQALFREDAQVEIEAVAVVP